MNQLDNTQQAPAQAFDDGSTGIELEDISGGEVITQPFDPALIRITTQSFNIDLLLKRIQQSALDLSPGFQRGAGIWTDEAQSRLVESLLVRIPIPAFYMDATEEDHWLVVDGLQRLTTLQRFIISKELRLSGLEFLTMFSNYSFDQLPAKYQRRILETQVTIYLIQEGTPPNVKFNIFKRINTGGLPLSAQEIRHALNQGKVVDLLKRLAESKEFKQATAYGISDKRMADRECVLRFLAFTVTPYHEYKGGDFDSFLNDAMSNFNRMGDSRIGELEKLFRNVMVTARQVFGDDAFRKRYAVGDQRHPINKALFEAWSVAFGKLDDQQTKQLVDRKALVIDRFIALMSDRQFDSAVSQGTGDPNKVTLRFERVEKLVKEVLAQ